MLDLSKEKQEENAAIRKTIEQKLAAEQELTTEEIWFMGDQIELDHLPNYPQCLDMYYRKLYILFMEAPIKLTTSGRGKLTTCFAGEDLVVQVCQC